jgi:hypothetical protein
MAVSGISSASNYYDISIATSEIRDRGKENDRFMWPLAGKRAVGKRGGVPEELNRSPPFCVEGRSIYQCSTVITTFPFLRPCSTYLNASEIRSKG